jgi:hypothetical protein
MLHFLPRRGEPGLDEAKYAVPFCECRDRVGVTRREGDMRVPSRTDALQVVTHIDRSATVCTGGTNVIRRGVRLLLVILFAIVLFINIRFYGDSNGEDTVAQLRFLRHALDQGAGEEMQRHFPEGDFFMHALYGAAWIEVGRAEPVGSALQREAQAEAKWALAQLESPAGRAPFPEGLAPAHGVFYAGWINWLRGGMLSLFPVQERPADEWRTYTTQSERIASAFAASDTPYLQSYAGRAWPVDSVVAIASLRLHDHLTPARFDAAFVRWRTQVQARLDPATGLIPHRADAITGIPTEGARGSSQALLLRFLLEIDPEMGLAH